jgi:hypothetical protein
LRRRPIFAGQQEAALQNNSFPFQSERHHPALNAAIIQA